VGSSVVIELKAEGGVERSQGKAKRVVDLRQR
jgi:phenylacetate-CoA ligase